MASRTLDVGPFFLAGTTLNAYLLGLTDNPDGLAPTASATATAVVASNGTVTFTGLSDGTGYWAGTGNAPYNYLRFTTPAATSSGSGGFLGAWSSLSTGSTVKAGQTVTNNGILYARNADGTIAATFTPANWTAIGPAAVASYPALEGLQPVNAQSAPPSGLSDGTKLWSEYRYRMTVGDDLSVVSFAFTNWYVNVSGSNVFDVDGLNDIRVACSIERLDGTFLPLLFGGDVLATIKPGGSRKTTPTDPDVPASDGYYWLRVYVEVTNLGEKWPLTGRALVSTNSEGLNSGTTAGTGATSTGAVTAAAGNAYSPVVTAGRTKLQRTKSLAVLHDSIGTGQGDSVATEGWIYRSLGPAAVSFVRLGRFSDRIQDELVIARRQRRWTYIPGATHALVALGVNDRRNARTFAQMQADAIALAAKLRARGVQHITWATATPLPTSGGLGFSTLADQTADVAGGGDIHRTNFNDWVRTLPAGVIDAYVDTADACESARNSGIFKINTGTGTLTNGNIAVTGVIAGSVSNGQTLTGPGIPSGATVVAQSGTTVNLSAAATADGLITFTYAGVTSDGVHPRKWVHDLMKTAMDAVAPVWQA